MRTFLYQYACILIAGLHSVTSSIIQARRASKMTSSTTPTGEFTSSPTIDHLHYVSSIQSYNTKTNSPFHSYNIYPDGHLDDAIPTFHHQPPIDECIGMDASTVSVRIQTGTGEAAALGFYVRGYCDHGDLGDYPNNITFNKALDGRSDCHAVVHDANNPGTTNVHDIMFSAEQA